jgi:hypothetical protein
MALPPRNGQIIQPVASLYLVILGLVGLQRFGISLLDVDSTVAGLIELIKEANFRPS